MNYEQWQAVIGQALAAPAAPAALVEQVLAKTTRRRSVWARYKMAFVGAVTAVVVALCVGVGSYFHSAQRAQTEFAAYVNQTQNDAYALFSKDLDTFEQEWY